MQLWHMLCYITGHFQEDVPVATSGACDEVSIGAKHRQPGHALLHCCTLLLLLQQQLMGTSRYG
jgi:hypothetical protein